MAERDAPFGMAPKPRVEGNELSIRLKERNRRRPAPEREDPVAVNFESALHRYVGPAEEGSHLVDVDGREDADPKERQFELAVMTIGSATEVVNNLVGYGG